MLLRLEGHKYRLLEFMWTLNTWKEYNALKFRKGVGRVSYSSLCFTTLINAWVNILVYNNLITPELWNCVLGALV
jgi:hypothetical protein